MNISGLIRRAGALVVLAALTAPVAWAGLQGPIFEIEACVGQSCFGYCAFYEQDGQWDPENGTFTWILQEDTPIMSLDGQTVLGVLEADGPHPTMVVFRSDPVVNLGFAVQAGSAPGGTVFTIKSALLQFPTINNPQGRASAAFTLTDGIDDDGATLTPLVGYTGAYLTQYNGFVPYGTTFTQLIDQMVAEPMSTVNRNEEYPGGGLYAPIGGPVSDMSTQIAFTLSANDLASGTTVFEIIPEPSGVLLLAAGLTALRRRR